MVTFIVQSVRDVLKDIECTTFSGVTLPGYLFSELEFLVLNLGNGQATTIDQDFFIYPVHGSLSHDDDVKVFYELLLHLDLAVTWLALLLVVVST